MLHSQLIRPLPELLARNTAERGERPAFTDDRGTVTWAELERRTARLAGHLRDRVERRKPVAICMANRLEAIESYLAVTRAGNLCAFLNPGASPPELGYMLEDSGAELLIADADQRARFATPRNVLDVDSEQYLGLLQDDQGGEPADDLELDEPAWMLYTSGTTGRPKGVLLTQRSCLWVVAACWAPIVGLWAEAPVLSALPLLHSSA